MKAASGSYLPADGLEILECDGLELTQDGQLLHVTTLGTGGGSLILSLRSGRAVTEHE